MAVHGSDAGSRALPEVHQIYGVRAHHVLHRLADAAHNGDDPGRVEGHGWSAASGAGELRSHVRQEWGHQHHHHDDGVELHHISASEQNPDVDVGYVGERIPVRAVHDGLCQHHLAGHLRILHPCQCTSRAVCPTGGVNLVVPLHRNHHERSDVERGQGCGADCVGTDFGPWAVRPHHAGHVLYLDDGAYGLHPVVRAVVLARQ